MELIHVRPGPGGTGTGLWLPVRSGRVILCLAGGEFRTLMGKKIQIHCACSDPKAELHQLRGPANPPLTSLSYLKTRSRAAAFISVHVIDLHPEEDLMRNVFISMRKNTVNIASDLQREIITHPI